MKNHTRIRLSIIMLGMLFFQCACQKTTTDTYLVPTTYNFDNVNYSDQTTKINMFNELVDYAKSANTMNASRLSIINLSNMYNNTNAPFSKTELNSSTKKIKNKFFKEVQDNFETYLFALVTTSQYTNQLASIGQAGTINQFAQPGRAGIMFSDDQTTSYLLNERGFEFAQFIEKEILTACFYYQATTIYLGETKMNVDNKAVITGKGTNMEHHWDESFGYYGAPIDLPSNTTNLKSWAKYSNKVDPIINCNSKIMNAYLEGRAAISAKDYDTRDAMRSNIKAEWENMIAAIAISYLNDAKVLGIKDGLRYHYLTGAYTFIMGLKYGASKALSDSEIDNILANLAQSSNPLHAGFFKTNNSAINNAIDALTAIYTQLAPVKTSL